MRWQRTYIDYHPIKRRVLFFPSFVFPFLSLFSLQLPSCTNVTFFSPLAHTGIFLVVTLHYHGTAPAPSSLIQTASSSLSPILTPSPQQSTNSPKVTKRPSAVLRSIVQRLVYSSSCLLISFHHLHLIAIPISIIIYIFFYSFFVFLFQFLFYFDITPFLFLLSSLVSSFSDSSNRGRI